jgi:hypothetical protein
MTSKWIGIVRGSLVSLLVVGAGVGGNAWSFAADTGLGASDQVAGGSAAEQDPQSVPPTLAPLASRFAAAEVDEVPDFQRHIGPLLGHLGCNGRACHGSFQGRGGFTLSLFGYDFAADHASLIAEGSGRVNQQSVDESLILYKPVDSERHEGGKRMELDSWQYRVLARWIAAGAEFDGELQQLERLVVEPAELLFSAPGQEVSLKVIAHWADGTSEEVTDLCRFTTNDDSVANISATGNVTAGDVGDTHVVVAYDRAVVPVAVLRPSDQSSEGLPRPPQSEHPIDLLVAQKLEKLGIVPSGICSDSDFVRRASLDLAGTLPSAERVERFVADASPGKREELIEELLNDPGYAAWWATRMSDWTGNNEAQLNNYLPVRGLASQMWFAWLKKRLAENVPYDQIVEGIVKAESRLPDESYLQYCETMSDICRTGNVETYAERPGMPIYWARNNFRTNEERAIGFAYSFLGVKVECAQCHKHPFDRWSKQDFDQFAALFSPVRATQTSYAPESMKEMRGLTDAITEGAKLNGGDLRRKMTEAVKAGKTVPFPELTIIKQNPRNRENPNKPNNRNRPTVGRSGRILGEASLVTIQGDPREALMAWLRSADNPYFAKAIVNRVWANYFGVGIVNPVDDLNLGNPPSNAALLEHLSQGFIDSGFDLHWLHRHIMTSDAYQRSSVPNVTNVQDTKNFSRHVPRRLPAEVLRDSIRLATAGAEAESRARTELVGRAINSDVGPGQPGQGPRGRDFALQVFGQSTRESNCDCDRSDQANLLQSLYLRNDIDMHQALAQRDGWLEQATSSWNPPAMSGRPGAAATSRVDARTREQMLKRIEAFLQVAEPRKDQMRQRLVKELQQVNSRRAQNDLEPLRFGELMREARETLRGGSMLTEEEVVSEEAADAPGVTPAAVDPPTVAQAEIDAKIRYAYLRTLSREPDAEELAIAQQHLRDAEHPVAGLRAVLWALLNTKEFVLTH